MRLDGYREILGFIGHRGLMSWHRMKRLGIPFEKDPRTRLVFSDSGLVAEWWKQEQVRRHERAVVHARKANRASIRKRIAHGSQDA